MRGRSTEPKPLNTEPTVVVIQHLTPSQSPLLSSLSLFSAHPSSHPSTQTFRNLISNRSLAPMVPSPGSISLSTVPVRISLPFPHFPTHLTLFSSQPNLAGLNKSKAAIEYDDPASASTAVSHMNAALLDGQKLSVEISLFPLPAPEPTPSPSPSPVRRRPSYSRSRSRSRSRSPYRRNGAPPRGGRWGPNRDFNRRSPPPHQRPPPPTRPYARRRSPGYDAGARRSRSPVRPAGRRFDSFLSLSLSLLRLSHRN